MASPADSAPDPDAPPRIAVFAGPTATIGNSPPLVTSNKARARHGLTLRPELRVDVLRPQRLAAPVTVYVEAFSAHPLEADAAELYAPPDGWLDARGTFHTSEPPGGGIAVHEVELRPEDGLYPLPYMARQADGSAWDDAVAEPFAPAERARQTFYPDASRIYEEIERLGVGGDGHGGLFGGAEFDFFRPAPSGGYTRGLAAARRTDIGEGDIPPETLGEDFFIYFPFHLRAEPHLAALAKATNALQRTLQTGRYVGAQWLEGSPTNEESMYWFGLLVDTTVPLVGHSAQRPHQSLSADGDRNIVDGVKYLLSGVALDDAGRDRIGAVMIVDELVFAARDITKTDARPGGYEATGGHGGIVADMGGYGPPQLTYLPARRHTHGSEVRLPLLPASTTGVSGSIGPDGAVSIDTVEVAVKDGEGDLLATAMPHVGIVKYSRYGPTGAARDGRDEVEIMARIGANLAGAPLAGFVGEGMSPYGIMTPETDAAFELAIFSGMPVVRVGRGNTGGMAYKFDPLFITGNNLTSTKARLLLMACLLRFGALPPAADPRCPTEAERTATLASVARYQAVFDTH
ncbi:MAG: hypothetical protein IT196_25840 [Acidimicrobiales bacterium]|nr:hypothetical protein [Acidimicrobiales bacterium]